MVQRKLGSLVHYLGQVWWWEGCIDGLIEHGLSGFPELLAQSPLALPGVPPDRVLVSPARGRLRAALTAINDWLPSAPEDCVVVVRAHDRGGLAVAELRQELAVLARRAARWCAVPAIHILDHRAPQSLEVRLFAAVSRFLPTPGPNRERHRRLATRLELEIAGGGPGVSPWPLRKARSIRVLAWPRWSDREELETLCGHLLAPLMARRDVSVVLRHDPQRDPALTGALEALRGAWERAHGPDAPLDVVLEHGPLGPVEWTRLDRAIDAALVAEGGRALPTQLTAPVLSTEAAVEGFLEGLAAGAAAIPVAVVSE